MQTFFTFFIYFFVSDPPLEKIIDCVKKMKCVENSNHHQSLETEKGTFFWDFTKKSHFVADNFDVMVNLKHTYQRL